MPRKFSAFTQDYKRSAAYKDKLRKKFVEKAKSYIGVPYAASYWKEGEKHHNAPLYLNCSTLIKQILRDLAVDFGFKVGRWNQAYLFDTLPISQTLNDMKPGDLVFYSGIYNDPKYKPQKNNMVHVEIFTGGENGL